MKPPIKNSTIGSPTARATSDGARTPARGKSAKARRDVTGIGTVSNIHQIKIQRVIPIVKDASSSAISKYLAAKIAKRASMGPDKAVTLI